MSGITFLIRRRILRQAQDERLFIDCHCESIPDREGEAISTNECSYGCVLLNIRGIFKKKWGGGVIKLYCSD
jgi:hypothetical protein